MANPTIEQFAEVIAEVIASLALPDAPASAPVRPGNTQAVLEWADEIERLTRERDSALEQRRTALDAAKYERTKTDKSIGALVDLLWRCHAEILDRATLDMPPILPEIVETLDEAERDEARERARKLRDEAVEKYRRIEALENEKERLEGLGADLQTLGRERDTLEDRLHEAREHARYVMSSFERFDKATKALVESPYDIEAADTARVEYGHLAQMIERLPLDDSENPPSRIATLEAEKAAVEIQRDEARRERDIWRAAFPDAAVLDPTNPDEEAAAHVRGYIDGIEQIAEAYKAKIAKLEAEIARALEPDIVDEIEGDGNAVAQRERWKARARHRGYRIQRLIPLLRRAYRELVEVCGPRPPVQRQADLYAAITETIEID